MGVSQNFRRINSNELKISSIIQKSFRSQLKYLLDNLKELYEQYPNLIEQEYVVLNRPTENIYKSREILESPMGWFRKAMWMIKMIDDVSIQIAKTTEKWYKRSYRLFEKDMEANGFRYDSQLPLWYAKTFGELNLSNYKWSISKTTKLKVTEILQTGLTNNIGVNEIAKQIQTLDATVFSKTRAKLIATTEVGKAYEHWNSLPIKQLQSVGVEMLKQRQTVNDSRVREEHTQNEEDWRIPLNDMFSWTGTELPPDWPWCRCTILYKMNK
jgi:SPP1 gp7 family putative phage head morphogenesis protein